MDTNADRSNGTIWRVMQKHWPVLLLALLGIWGYIDLEREVGELSVAVEALSATPGKASNGAQHAGRQPPLHHPDRVSDESGPDGVPEAPDKVSWECEDSIEHDQVMEVVGRHGQGVFDCYKLLLGRSPEAAGVLELHLNVGSGGEVREARVKSLMDDPQMLECVRQVIFQWQFPQRSGDDCAIVVIPFSLRPEDHLESVPMG